MNDAFRNNLIEKIGAIAFAKIERSHIGLAGAGGLGSNCAATLARVGFTRFTIADFDIIDHSNLDRQFYFFDQVGRHKMEALRENLRRINPDAKLNMIMERVDRSNVSRLFSSCDAVAECLDTAEGKSIFVSEIMRLNKFVVSVSGLGGIGSSDDIRVHRIRDNLIIIGDLKSDIAYRPALAPRVVMTAAKQADVILEYIVNKHA